LRTTIATRNGSCWWDVDHAGWVVTLDSPERQAFSGRTLEEGLAWCLVWLMAPELGIGPFRVCCVLAETGTLCIARILGMTGFGNRENRSCSAAWRRTRRRRFGVVVASRTTPTR
jgi:hypothetical protein